MNYKRILFLVPPNEYLDDKAKNYNIPTKVVPYGVLSIASYLKEYLFKKVEVKIIDFSVQNISIKEMSIQIKDMIREFKPDIVGVSALFNSTYPYLNMYFDTIKEFDKKIITVVGGGLATNMYGELLDKMKNLDAVCFSEGEIPFLELVDAEDMEYLLNTHVSWITRGSQKNRKIPQATLIDDLDELPFIDFSLINLEHYGARAWYSTVRKDETTIHALPIHTTRGCPYNCIFCCAGRMHGKKLRQMSAQRVIEHVKDMVNKYGIRRLTIDDDQFLLTKERSKEILREIAQFNLVLETESGLSVKFIDDEMAMLLKKAGLDTAVIAVESGSEYILKQIMDKPLNLDEVKIAVRNLRRYGFQIKAFFVVGLPGETDEHRRQTTDFIHEIGFDWSLVNVATPLKGSRLYEQCIDKGYFTETELNDSNLSMRYGIMNTPEFTAEYINEQAYLMNLDVNFVNNYNMKTGKPEIALTYFETVVAKYPDQAFAHYYLARVYEELGKDKELIMKHDKIFEDILKMNKNWYNYAKHFSLVE